MSTISQRPSGSGAGSPATPGPAERLLAVATNLFATQGIRAVGIDQILREAGVAKASLYSSYGSKEALVIAYLSALDQRDRNRFTDAVRQASHPIAKVLTFFDLAAAGAPARDFRGCLYANAATELPGIELAPVREHRHWMRDTVAELLSAAGIDRHDELAAEIQLIYDGAMVGCKTERSVAPITRGRLLAAHLIGSDGE